MDWGPDSTCQILWTEKTYQEPFILNILLLLAHIA